ncbi:hypothetical protein AAULR_06171, partial [Lacticaseibacillus rhamnosus MTCC 5462]
SMTDLQEAVKRLRAFMASHIG